MQSRLTLRVRTVYQSQMTLSIPFLEEMSVKCRLPVALCGVLLYNRGGGAESQPQLSRARHDRDYITLSHRARGGTCACRRMAGLITQKTRQSLHYKGEIERCVYLVLWCDALWHIPILHGLLSYRGNSPHLCSSRLGGRGIAYSSCTLVGAKRRRRWWLMRPGAAAPPPGGARACASIWKGYLQRRLSRK